MHINTLQKNPERIHPALWRASQLAQPKGQYIDTGHAALSHQLPGSGWPVGQLVNLLLPQHGIGELQLLMPALAYLSNSPIVLLNPPHQPHVAAWMAHNIPAARLLWLRTPLHQDALWAARQVLYSAAFSALLLWLPAVPYAALRQLQLAARQSNMLFFVLQPSGTASQSSPSPLRLQLQASPQQLQVSIIKRQGSVYPGLISIATHSFIARPAYAPLDRHSFTTRAASHSRSRHGHAALHA